MPTKRSLVMSLALLSTLAPVGCRRYSVVPPSAPSRPATEPQQTSPVPPELLAPPLETRPGLPSLQIPAAHGNPWKPTAKARDWKHIVLHHTATSRGSVESIHEAHLKRRDGNGNPWLGIGYHFVVGNGNGMPDGEVEPTFRWRQQLHGAHAGVGDYNRQGIGIVLVGNFETQRPTDAQLAAVKQLVAALRTEYGIGAKNIIGHSDIKATACPGKYFTVDDVIAARPAAGVVQFSPSSGETAYAPPLLEATRVRTNTGNRN